MLFKMFVVFEIFLVKDNPVWAPKIPNYVTYDHQIHYEQNDIDMINISCSIIDNKLFMVKKIFDFYF